MQQQNKQAQPARAVGTPFDEIGQGFGWFEYMRANYPVSRDENGGWNIFRYDDVYQVINDPVTFSSEDVPNFSHNAFLRETIVALDPPVHRRLRYLANQGFTKAAITRIANNAIPLAQTLFDQMREKKEVEIVSEFTFPLTTRAIAVMLEVPEQDWPLVVHWVRGTDKDTPPRSREEASIEQNRMGQQVYDYFKDKLTELRRQPHEGLLSDLIAADVNGDRLTDDEILKFCVLLVVAGQETVQNLLNNALYCFTRFPATLDHLMRHHEAIPSALEEVLRYLPPFWISVRRTTVDTVVRGQHIPAKAIVQAWNASANRDPEYFPDPNRFDILREPNRHLTFGYGIHFCVGAPVARLESRMICQMLFQQFKSIERVSNDPIPMGPGPLYHVESMRLRFEPRG
ncbi:cytochrome P450 [Dictyobacter aurantiacus]|uniref:Cytochrome P450 n=1 Tax=Dictyobacter aurantiacus TaxID=1936993 RepID=A0A401ZKR4_9CHLR|nr:cytochrome P450 [Dictyobacter aurantiacus]GCE07404.1 cytochrome P450 [Dictyobacter aurantiacus]